RIVDSNLRPDDGIPNLAVRIAEDRLRHDLAGIVAEGDSMGRRGTETGSAKNERLTRLMRHPWLSLIIYQGDRGTPCPLPERFARDADVECLIMACIPAHRLFR